jgi:hypothetical protein
MELLAWEPDQAVRPLLPSVRRGFHTDPQEAIVSGRNDLALPSLSCFAKVPQQWIGAVDCSTIVASRSTLK